MTTFVRFAQSIVCRGVVSHIYSVPLVSVVGRAIGMCL